MQMACKVQVCVIFIFFCPHSECYCSDVNFHKQGFSFMPAQSQWWQTQVNFTCFTKPWNTLVPFFFFFFVIPMLSSKQIHFCRGRLMLHQISGLMRIRWVVQFCCSFTHYASRSWRYCSLEQNTTLLLVVVSFCSATASAVCPVLTS